MNGHAPKPSILGLTGYLAAGLAIAVTYLVAHIILGLNRVHRAVGSDISTTVRDGAGLTFTFFALLVVLPLIVAALAALMGRHGAHTGQTAGGAAALTTLIGVPLVWVNMAIAALVVAAVLGSQGRSQAFDSAVESVLTSGVGILVILGPLVGLAAVVASRASAWSAATAAATGHGHYHEHEHEHEEYGGYPEEHAEGAGGHEILADHPINCPRCGTTFHVSGQRPLKIACPACGKTGTLH